MSDTVTMENAQPDRQPDAIALLHSQASSENIFSILCSSLLETVTSNKVIQDRSLLDFSRFAVQIISNSIEVLPKSFNLLLEAFLDYLHYSVRNDSDKNRALSYIRAYQITSVLDVYRTEQKNEDLLRKELKVNQQDRNLLYCIFQSPGITSSELQAKLDVSEPKLRERTRQLEEKKLLNSYQTEYEDEPYYMLSRLGRDFCQYLFAPQTHRVIPNQWSLDRVCILYFLLGTQLEPSDDDTKSVPVMTWIRKVSELREDDVQYFASKMKKHVKKHMKKHMFEEDSDKDPLISSWNCTALPRARGAAYGLTMSQFDSQPHDYDKTHKGGYYSERYFGSEEN